MYYSTEVIRKKHDDKLIKGQQVAPCPEKGGIAIIKRATKETHL